MSTLMRCTLFLLLGLLPVFAQKAPRPTNVLVLVADDLGWNGVSYHNPKMTTPALAKLPITRKSDMPARQAANRPLRTPGPAE